MEIMERKYELLTDDVIEINGCKAYRIRATKTFGDVNEGDLGGRISEDGILPHSGNVWVYYDSVVLDTRIKSANIYIGKNVYINSGSIDDGAHIGNNVKMELVQVCENAYICDDVSIDINSYIGKNANIGKGVKIAMCVHIEEYSNIGRGVLISTTVHIEGYSQIRENTIIDPFAHICHHATIGANVHIGKTVVVCQYTKIRKGSKIGEDSVIGPCVEIEENACVNKGCGIRIKAFCQNCNQDVACIIEELPMKVEVKHKLECANLYTGQSSVNEDIVEIYEYIGHVAHCSKCNSDIHTQLINDLNLRGLYELSEEKKRKIRFSKN